MSRLLIVFATREGQTQRIAEAVAERLRQTRHEVELRAAAEAMDVPEGADFDGVVLGASVHRGRFDTAMQRWIEAHRDLLGRVPSRFFSVSLAAASENPDERQAARDQAQAFLEDCGVPELPLQVFAGALRYSRYGWFTRRIMRSIARKEGGGTDFSRDYEYTDWEAVRAFADQVAAASGVVAPA